MRDYIFLLRELRSRGIEKSWLVGGVLRDAMLDHAPSDVDIVCDEKSAEALIAKTGGTVVGKPPFCTVGASLSGFSVEISLLTGRSIEKDLERRDFTVNAMAMDAEGTLIDPFGGAADIWRRVLRLVPSPVLPYDADPVRVVRLLRFACTLGFSVDPETESVTKYFVPAHRVELANVPGERYGKEFLKGFASRPHFFLRLLEDFSLLPEVLPEIEAMRGVEQPFAFHPEGDVLEHTFRVIEEAEKMIGTRPERRDVVLALAALLHDAGKPQAAGIHPKYGYTSFFGHEKVSEKIALGLMRAWAVPGKIASQAAALVRHHMIPGGDFTKRTGVKLTRRLGPELSDKLFDLALCDARGAMGDGKKILAARELFCEVRDNLLRAEGVRSKRLLNGHDVIEILDIPPGRRVGRILEELDVAVGAGELRDRNNAVKWLKRYYTKSSCLYK